MGKRLVAAAFLAALGRWEELALHTRATGNTGASEDDLKELMLHVAVYAGVPAANHAVKVVKDTLAQMRAAQAG